MSVARTIPDGNGGALDAVASVAGSVAGSPFSATATAADTPELAGPGVVLHTSATVHLRVHRASENATVSDMPYEAGRHLIPLTDGDIISMRAATTATVHVEAIRTV